MANKINLGRILILLTATTTINSCGKRYTCYCERQMGTSIQAIVHEENKLTRGRAKKWCETFNVKESSYGTVSCYLK